MVDFSFEFFPPKTDLGAAKLLDVHTELAALAPEYFSITYGAGGSTRERTLSSVDALHGRHGIAAVPHMSCIGDSKDEVRLLLERYKNQGITQLVALRGDLPSGQVGLGDIPYASDLVAFIRAHTGDHFNIAVAAYPEMHPQADSFAKDFAYFSHKVASGADSAITQFFYNPDSYFYFVEACASKGINIPIVPGIMPITNASNILRFADGCGAEVPRWIRKRLIDFGDDSASIQAFGLEVVTNLCEQLIAGGAPALHFYSMNQVEPSQQLVCNLGLR